MTDAHDLGRRYFSSAVASAQSRQTFAANILALYRQFSLDGIDLDFEYPNSDALSSGFASLLGELRTAFNNLQAQKGDSTPYELTVRSIECSVDGEGSLISFFDNY